MPAETSPSRTIIKPAVWLSWLIALVMLTVAFRIADGIVWFGQDDASYYDAAEHLLSGETITRVHHHYARMSLIVPTTASVALFGSAPLTLALPTIIVSILLPVVIALLGRLVWGWWEGLCAASIVTLLPYVRSLGTTTLPDMHALFFTTLAVAFILLAARAPSRRAVIALAFAAGFSLGWAASAKIFSLSAGPFMLLMFVHQRRRQGGRSIAGITSLILGGVALWLADGLFFLYVADDFFFKWHALKSAQGQDTIFSNAVASWSDYARIAYQRVTLLFDPAASRWGWIALAFWPAAAWTLWRGRGKLIALWAIAAYAILALAPVRFDGWPQPYPCFSTRVAITTCVPFALCVAWATRHLMSERFFYCHAVPLWPVAIAAAMALTWQSPRDLNAARVSDCQRVGLALQTLIHETDWSADDEIYLPASLYIRHRILFPPELRDQLRVAVDDASPDWWRAAAADIKNRVQPLPTPGTAYLVATPQQLRGEPEAWDYDVTLPRESLSDWTAQAKAIEVDATLRCITREVPDSRHSPDESLLTMLVPSPQTEPQPQVTFAQPTEE